MTIKIFGLYLTWRGRASVQTEAQPNREHQTLFYGFGWGNYVIGIQRITSRRWLSKEFSS